MLLWYEFKSFIQNHCRVWETNKSFGIFYATLCFESCPCFSCSVFLSFCLLGLSLFTWHCPSRHRTSSQRSHLPNRHIHSLQKCQADKVSNPMPFLNKGFCFFFSCLKTCQGYVKRAFCFGATVYLTSSSNPSKDTLRKESIQGFWFWKLLWGYNVRKCDNYYCFSYTNLGLK